LAVKGFGHDVGLRTRDGLDVVPGPAPAHRNRPPEVLAVSAGGSGTRGGYGPGASSGTDGPPPKGVLGEGQ
jgi:hypothetical protein